MIPEDFRGYIVRFLMILAAMLVAMSIYFGVESIFISRPIITALDEPFLVCEDSKIVKPGDYIRYNISYYKRLEIPGELTKQLIIKDDQTGMEYYLPLEFSSGNLPTGYTKTLAFVRIPTWTPEGVGRIKITSSHFTGRTRQFMTVYTDTFKVRK